MIIQSHVITAAVSVRESRHGKWVVIVQVCSLFDLQAIRLIANSKRCAHTAPLFQHLQLLTIPQIYKYKVGVFMYKLKK